MIGLYINYSLPQHFKQENSTHLYHCIWRGSLTQITWVAKKLWSSHDVLTHLILLIELHSSNVSSAWMCLKGLETKSTYSPNGDLMVIYRGTSLKEKTPWTNPAFQKVSWSSKNHAPQQSTGCGSGTSGTNKTQSSDWIVIASGPMGSIDHPKWRICKWSGLQSGQIRIPKPELTGFGWGLPYETTI